jgi:hypothetical protein
MGQPHSSVFPETVLHDALHAFVVAAGVSPHAASRVNFARVGLIAAILVPVCAAAALLIWDHLRQEERRVDEAALAAYQELAADVAVSAAALRAQMAILVERGRAVERLVRGVG